MKAKKIAVWVAAILVVILAGGWLYVRHLARKGLPDYSADVVLKGVTGTVTVYRDEHAVPHIYADNERDLYLAVGYVMAQDRLWQMDLIRRVTQGRLSEIFGKDMVEVDELFRALRIPEKSEMVIRQSDKNIQRALEMFSAGVNQYIKEHLNRLPLEFSILGYAPEEWKAIHSVNLIGYMAWDLTNPWDIEPVLYRVLEKAGKKKYMDIIPGKLPETRIYTELAENRPEMELRYSLVKTSQILEDMGLAVFSASNNWAVSGRKSITGKPLLANDMHLGLNAPGIWYQMHHSVDKGVEVTGVVLPGQPFVVCGHNRDIAWGMTNVGVDDMDFYEEKINPKNPNEYMYNGKWLKMEVRREKINIKGGTHVEKELLLTRHGPVISKFRKLGDKAITMKWLGNEYSNEMRTIYLLNRAKNWDDFRNAISTFSAASQNIAYADTKGNIGLYCAAGIPIRKKGKGMDIVPGWTDEYEWIGTVPFEKKPHSYNPKSGFVSSANNKTAPDNYPYYIATWFSPPYRIDRIREMLTSKEKLGAGDFKLMQTDKVSKRAQLMKPDMIAELKKCTTLNDKEKAALDVLEKWDCVELAESAGAALHNQFFQDFVRNTFADEMGSDLFEDYIKTKVFPEYGVQNLWANKASGWFDDVTTKEKKESFSDIVVKSFKDSVKWLGDNLGGNPEKWQWGDLHTFTLKHPLGSVKLLDMVFNLNRGPFPTAGSGNTVGPFSFKYNKAFMVDHGASHRHIFDCANWDASLTIIPTGNSGMPASKYYCDQTRLYLDEIYHADYISRPLVEKTAKYTMKITGK